MWAYLEGRLFGVALVVGRDLLALKGRGALDGGGFPHG